MWAKLRLPFAVFLGLIVAFIVIGVVEAIGHKVYPLPSDVDPNDFDQVIAYVAHAPIEVFLFVLLAFASGSFLGGLATAFMARPNPRIPCLFLGGLLTIVGVMNVVMVPVHPTWFIVAMFACFLPFTYLASRLVPNPPKPVD